LTKSITLFIMAKQTQASKPKEKGPGGKPSKKEGMKSGKGRDNDPPKK
jgi:hypothetical protein